MTPQGQAAIPYSFDAAGNRSSMGSGPSQLSYTYDAADQLTSVAQSGQPTVNYGYDQTGNQTSRGSDSFAGHGASRQS